MSQVHANMTTAVYLQQVNWILHTAAVRSDLGKEIKVKFNIQLQNTSHTLLYKQHCVTFLT